MENVKLSTSRDFRINTDAVVTAVEQGVSSDDECENSSDDKDGEKSAEINQVCLFVCFFKTHFNEIKDGYINQNGTVLESVK